MKNREKEVRELKNRLELAEKRLKLLVIMSIRKKKTCWENMAR